MRSPGDWPSSHALHALHDLDLGDQQRVLAQQVAVGVEGLVEHDDLGLVLAVVERDERHLAAARRLRANRRHDAGDADRRVVGCSAPRRCCTRRESSVATAWYGCPDR